MQTGIVGVILFVDNYICCIFRPAWIFCLLSKVEIRELAHQLTRIGSKYLVYCADPLIVLWRCHAGSMNETDKKHSKHLKNSVKCNTLDISITINYH